MDASELEKMSTDDIYELVKMAEQAERFDDMKMAMKNYVDRTSEKLDSTRRNLLSVAYKNVVGTRRTAWRVLTGLDSSNTTDLCNTYKEKIKDELHVQCMEIINLLDEKILKDDVLESLYKDDYEGQVFFYKMKGDYYRYIAEVSSGDEKKELAEKAEEAYKAANEICEEKLDPSSSIRLGHSLNYSVFCYEIMENPKLACELARKAFDGAIAELENENEGNESVKDSTLILQLLRDNLTLWNSEKEDQ